MRARGAGGGSIAIEKSSNRLQALLAEPGSGSGFRICYHLINFTTRARMRAVHPYVVATCASPYRARDRAAENLDHPRVRGVEAHAPA
jgi:hypothetical protein